MNILNQWKNNFWWNYQNKIFNEVSYAPTLIFPPPGLCVVLSREPILGFALSLKSNFTLSIFFSPPPGLWVALSKEPTFGLAFHCSFTCVIWNKSLLNLKCKWLQQTYHTSLSLLSIFYFIYSDNIDRFIALKDIKMISLQVPVNDWRGSWQGLELGGSEVTATCNRYL